MEYFKILGCPVTATVNDAVKAYKEKARVEHPDKGGDCSRFQELSASFEMVKKIIEDPVNRRLINSIKTRGKGGDITVNCYITLEEYFQGTNLNLHFTRKKINLVSEHGCRVCLGSGLIINKNNFSDVNICGVCGGIGVFDCLKEHNSSLKLELHPFFEKRKLFFEGDGHQCYNGEPGDLYVNINVKRDPLFIIKESDLHTKLDIKLADALVGYSTLIYHPSGDIINYSTENVIKPRETIIFKNKGIKKKDNSFGDFIVNIDIIFPDKINEETRELIKKLL
jgi:DnaJ-class molecular chaperone